MGSDHRSVKLQSRLAKLILCDDTKKKGQIKTNIRWQQVNIQKYKTELDMILNNISLELDLDKRCNQIEQSLIEAARLSQASVTHMSDFPVVSNESIKILIKDRKAAATATERAKLSKQIQKAIRKNRRQDQQIKIGNIIEEFRGLNRIAMVKARGRRDMITHMIDKAGNTKHERQSIANVFADFYGELYASKCEEEDRGRCWTQCDIHNPIEPFTKQELVHEIEQLKFKKAKDVCGIFAEMIKSSNEFLVDILLDLYNRIIDKNMMPPEKWKQTVMNVLFKSGSRDLPENYRPISIIPILYKLFAKLLSRGFQ